MPSGSLIHCASSNLLLSPSSEFFFSVTVLFYSRISIWFFLYNPHLYIHILYLVIYDPTLCFNSLYTVLYSSLNICIVVDLRFIVHPTHPNTWASSRTISINCFFSFVWVIFPESLDVLQFSAENWKF